MLYLLSVLFLLELGTAADTSLSFPCDFVWGSATSAFQIEGAVNEDGRGQTIWDTFCHSGHCFQNETGDIAADHYHRVSEDVDLQKAIGFKAYKMSFSWARLFPTGRAPINSAAVDHYKSEISLLLQAGITPWVTLFHWDLPQALEDEGGWLVESTARAFADYADAVFQSFGDDVKYWLTINDPLTYVMKGYCDGLYAPGRCDNRTRCDKGDSLTEPYLAAHNMLLGHAYATNVYKSKYASQKGFISIALRADWVEPLDATNQADIDAANKQLDFTIGWFADPIYLGRYPDSMRAMLGDRLPTFTQDQLRMLAISNDFFALNYYSAVWATALAPIDPSPTCRTDSGVTLLRENAGVSIGSATDVDDLRVVPRGIRLLPDFLNKRYGGNLEFYITESGIAVPNESDLDLDQALHDTIRVNFYRDYLTELMNGMNQNNLKIAGFFARSLLDGFEWADGYRIRFGIIYVDFDTLMRSQKDSALFFKNLLATQCPSQPPPITDCNQATAPPNCNKFDCFMDNESAHLQCTECEAGWFINRNGLCSACTVCRRDQVESVRCSGFTDTQCSGGEGGPVGNFNCTLPNCKVANCWDADDIQCAECNRGFYINSNLECTSCRSCDSGEYVSWPCEGYTDTSCSPCYTEACGPCQVGWVLDLYGQCVKQNCMVQGCGAADLDVICRELNASHFLCICPEEKVTTLALGASFVGCAELTGTNNGGNNTNPPPPPEKIVAHINSTHLEAFLINGGVLNVTGVIMGDVDGRSFTLTIINVSLPLDRLADILADQIAKFLGGDFTADDITIVFTDSSSKKRANHDVQVTVGGDASDASTLAQLYMFTLALLVVAFLG